MLKSSWTPNLRKGRWVLLSQSPEGGLEIGGHANTNADITAVARAALQGQTHGDVEVTLTLVGGRSSARPPNERV